MVTKITWAAIYKDGSVLTQYEADGVERSSEEIDRAKLQSVVLYFNGKPFIAQHLEPGQRLIFRRRGLIEQGAALDGSQDITRFVYLLGWQQKAGEKNIQHIAYIFEGSGRIEMAGRFREKNPYDAPVWLPCDEQCVEG